MDEGTLLFAGIPVDIEDREGRDSILGKIKNYNTNQSYVAFHYRSNEFLEDYEDILEDAQKLGIIK